MATYNSISDALAAIQKKLEVAINNTLESEVAEEVRDAEVIAIGSTVYAAYGSNDDGEPNVYPRRYDDGGLVDRKNMIAEVSSGELAVTNITPADPDYGNAGYFAGEIVIDGGPYNYKKGKNTFGDFRTSRDFISATYSNLKQSKWHVDGLKRGLTKQGFDVK